MIFFNNIFDSIPNSFLKSYCESYDKQLPSIDASPSINAKFTKFLDHITQTDKVQPCLYIINRPCCRILWKYFIKLVKIHLSNSNYF